MKPRFAQFMEWDRKKDVAECGRQCIGCGWGCDDPELELCCDCFDEATAKAMLRGEYGKEEQREICASLNSQ